MNRHCFSQWRGALWPLVVLVLPALLYAMPSAFATEPSRPLAPAAAEYRAALFLPHSSPFWDRFESFARAASDDIGLQLEVHHAGMSTERMLGQVRTAAVNGIDAILFMEFQGVGEAIVQIAEQHEIPALLFNTSLDDETLLPRVHYRQWVGGVIPNDKEAGIRLMTHLLNKAENEGAKAFQVLAFTGRAESRAHSRRLAGLKSVMDARPDVTLVDSLPDANNVPTTAMRFDNALTEHPEINIVWSHNDQLALAAAEHYQQLGRSEAIVFGGIDWSPKAINGVADGLLDVNIGGHVFDGAQSVIMIFDYLNGHDFAEEKLLFDSNMIALERQNAHRFQKILSDPGTVDYKALSKTHNPARQQYRFDLNQLASKAMADIGLSQEQRQWLKNHPVLRFGADPDWPPFDFVGKDGISQGLSADYLQLLSQRLGIKIEVVADKPWPVTLAMLKDKQLDGIGAIVRNPEREQYARFTQPYNEFSSVIFTRQDHPAIDRIDDLSNTTVAVERGFFTQDTLRRDYPDIALLEVDSTLQALEAVSQRRADAYIGTLAVGSYLMEKHFITNLKIAASTPFEIGGLSIAVRDDWPQLVSILNKALDSISTAERIEIRRRWVSFDALPAQPRQKTIGLTEQERAWLREHPEVKFTGDPNWLPFEAFTEKGEFIGITAALLDNLEQRTGVTFERLPSGTWLNALAMVKNGEVDIISDDVEVTALQRTHTFTRPYLERPLAIVMRSDQSELIPDLNDIAHKRIAVIEGYGYVGKLNRRYPEIDFIKVEHVQEGLIGLSSGRFDAFVATFTLSSYQINQMGMSNLRIVGNLPVAMKMGLAVRNDWPELLAILNKAIDAITPAEKQEIVNQWMQDKYIDHVNYRLIWQIVAAAVAVLLLMLLWNYSIRRQKERLRTSEERFQLAMAATSDGIWDWNIATGETYFSPGYLTMLGYSVNELPSRNETWEQLLHPDDKDTALAVVEKAIRDNAPQYEHEFRLRAKDGSYRNILSRGGVVSQDEQGNALRSIGTQRDITERKQAEEMLRKLSRAVEQSPSMVMITDCEGVIEYVNPKFTEVTGYEAQEILGQTPARLKSGLTAPSLYREMWQAISAGRNWHGDLQNRKKNGDIFWERETISPLLGNDGVIQHYVALKEDITARKVAEENLRVFQRFAETSGQGFGITTLDGEISYVNQTLCRMLGEESADAVCGNNFGQYYPADIQARFQNNIMPLLKEKGRWMGELSLINTKGEKIPTLENLFIIRDERGKARHFGNVVTDITLQKNAEKALKYAKDEAEQASRFKSEFLANMSHEIRTPLNAIMGMAHLAQKTELTPRQHDYLNKINISSRTLLGVINDILDFSKIEAGRLEMEKTDFLLEGVFENLSNLESMQAAEKGVEIIYSIDKGIPRTLVGDPLRLGQVLINLTNNAIKFTEQGQIVVAVTLQEEQADRIVLRFSVQDSGIGIERDQVTRLFEPFTQADGSTTRRYGGSGLGLAICKQLVAMMNGEIGVESDLGSGSTFYFSAVFGRAHNSIENQYLLAADLRGTRVLVVDDNAIARETLKDMLASFSFDVTTVSSGAAALAALEEVSGKADKRPYELVLMDWKMPGMDGVEASRLIHQSGLLPRLPTIIMVTAYGREEVMQEASQAGIDGFLMKPVNPSTLFDTIIETLSPQDGSTPVSLPEETGVPDLHGARVLVVEDNRINQQVAREMLENAGIEVNVVANGALAVQAIRANTFDLVLMDLQMPDMDGFQATRMIRKDSRFRTLPIVAMTAHAMAGDREKCLGAGMNEHLPKPIDPGALYAILCKWITVPKGEAVANAASKHGTCEDDALPNKLPGLDISKGLGRIGGNRRLFRTLLQEFVEDHRNDSQALANALGKGDNNQARHLVHTLRSVAGSIGAEHLEAQAALLEQALAKGLSYDELHLSFAKEFNIVMNGLIDALALMVAKSPVCGKENGDGDVQYREKAHELDALLAQGSAEAKGCFSQCRPYLDKCARDAELSKLEEQIASYDFEDARSTLRNILSQENDPKPGHQ